MEPPRLPLPKPLDDLGPLVPEEMVGVVLGEVLIVARQRPPLPPPGALKAVDRPARGGGPSVSTLPSQFGRGGIRRALCQKKKRPLAAVATLLA